MQVDLTPADLRQFEDEVASLFLQKKIRAPVHLEGGSEQQLIEVFRRHVEPQDWVLGGWRMHLKCLLKGVPKVVLLKDILAGRSISLCYKEHRILSSAIVGGVAPIAVGLAMGIKRKQATEFAGRLPYPHEYRKVVCFLGDMTAETGIAYESIKYAINHALPVLWVVEDNGVSVQTDTLQAWGGPTTLGDPSIIRYSYKNTWPHVGVGEWIQF